MTVFLKYNYIFCIDEKIEGLITITQEEYKQIENLAPKAFVKAIEVLYYLKGTILK